MWGIWRELQRGTLESNVAPPMGLLEMVVSLALSWMLMDSVIMAVVFLTGVVAFGVSLSWTALLNALSIVGLAFLAFLGSGLVSAGLVRVFKNIGPFVQIFEFLVLFISGVFFPLSTLPRWLVIISDLIPLTHSANAVRRLLVDFPYSAVAGEVAWLLILIPLYWLASYALFRWAEKTARVMGYGGY